MKPTALLLTLLLALFATGCGGPSTTVKPDAVSPASAALPSSDPATGGSGPAVALSGGTALEVVGARLGMGGRLLGVGYRLKGAEALTFGDTYVIGESDGARYEVSRVAKIGNLAPQRLKDLPDNIPSLYTLFETNYLIKPGDKVTVVVNGMKVEHVEVQP